MRQIIIVLIFSSFLGISVFGQQSFLLNEEFTDNSNNWDVGKDKNENSEIRLGKYLMENYTKNAWNWYAIESDLDGNKEFLIESSINKLNSYNNEDIYGLIWGTEDAENCFAFVVNTINQTYTAFSIYGGTWFNLINWQKSNHINYGNTTNKLGIAKIGKDLIFLVNDEPVNKTPAQEFYGKHIGFFVGPKIKIAADNLLVKHISFEEDFGISNDSWTGNGTGFFISNDGYLATNYHVVAEASEIEIEFIRNGQKQNYKVKVIQSDEQNDLAILKIDDPSFSSFSSIPYNFKTSLSEVGSNVFALGYPLALSVMGTEIKFTDGKISSKTGYKGEISTYQMTTPIQPGNSGGPLFDFDGNLIGVNSSKIRADVADNVSYAIKSSYLKNLLDVLPTTLSLPNDKSIVNKTLTEKIKIISDYVVLIRIK